MAGKTRRWSKPAGGVLRPDAWTKVIAPSPSRTFGKSEENHDLELALRTLFAGFREVRLWAALDVSIPSGTICQS